MSHEEHDSQTEKEIRRIVQEYGWYVALFEADTATSAFAYSIGLWKNYGHPEIILFGLEVQTMGKILNLAGEKVKSGRPLLADSADFDILDFKFFEKRNLAVFVTKQIFKGNKPILYVSHDSEDGDWQFLTEDTITNEEIMIVSLEEVVKQDPTINELFNLARGQFATRDFTGGKWLRQNEEE
jgi:hypothetical protein